MPKKYLVAGQRHSVIKRNIDAELMLASSGMETCYAVVIVTDITVSLTHADVGTKHDFFDTTPNRIKQVIIFYNEKNSCSHDRAQEFFSYIKSLNLNSVEITINPIEPKIAHRCWYFNEENCTLEAVPQEDRETLDNHLARMHTEIAVCFYRLFFYNTDIFIRGFMPLLSVKQLESLAIIEHLLYLVQNNEVPINVDFCLSITTNKKEVTLYLPSKCVSELSQYVEFINITSKRDIGRNKQTNILTARKLPEGAYKIIHKNESGYNKIYEQKLKRTEEQSYVSGTGYIISAEQRRYYNIGKRIRGKLYDKLGIQQTTSVDSNPRSKAVKSLQY